MRLPTEARINNVPPVRLGPGNAPGATITSILIFRANVLNNLQPTSAGTAAPSANTDSGKQSFPTLASICKSTAEPIWVPIASVADPHPEIGFELSGDQANAIWLRIARLTALLSRTAHTPEPPPSIGFELQIEATRFPIGFEL
jgi:hypothetical protein